MSKLYIWPWKDDSYQASIHLANRFQRKWFFFQKSTNQKQELPVAAMFANGSKVNEQSSKDASYQVSIHFADRFQSRRFSRNQPIRNKNCLWRQCLSTNRISMNNIYRGLSNDVSYQYSIHLAKRRQRRRLFRNQPIRNKNFLWRPCLLTDQN
jgi:hypothetical protein